MASIGRPAYRETSFTCSCDLQSFQFCLSSVTQLQGEWLRLPAHSAAEYSSAVHGGVSWTGRMSRGDKSCQKPAARVAVADGWVGRGATTAVSPKYKISP